MQGLNNKQLEACCHIDGPLLILAGAGSGKTRVITHRIAYLMNEMDVNPYNILAITFTNKAANEMRERVDNLIGFGSESVWVSTFHSMCVRILRKHIDKIGMSKDFTIYDDTEQKVVVREIIKDEKLDPKLYSEKNILSIISKAKEDYVSPDDYERDNATSYRSQAIARVYREYQRRLQRNNALDFDDLIYKTIFLFETNPDVLREYQERFKYIMVDEYQDTNHTQFILVKQLAAKYRNLCLVGDDDQSIYKFRGANIYNILNFEKQYPDAKVVKLEQNYRSTSNILNAANSVIANNEGRKDKTLWTENEEGEKITFTKYGTGFEEASGIASKIRSLRSQGVSLNDISVLYRTNNQSRLLEEKLIMENIPYILYGGTDFYKRMEVKDIVCYLKVLANPCDDMAVKRIINVPKRGIGDTTINKISTFANENNLDFYDVLLDIEECPGVSRAVDKIKGFVDMVEEIRNMQNDPDCLPSNIFDAVIEKTGYVELLNLENTDEARARIENINELKNKVVTYEESAEYPNLVELLEEIALVADNDNIEDDDTDKITLMTLHRAKGLEFPYVFICGMEDGLFPSKMSIDSDDPDALEEERRLCYVGITRAMEKLFISAAEQRMINGSTNYCQVSRFVKEIPKQYVEMQGDFTRLGDNGDSSRFAFKNKANNMLFGVGDNAAARYSSKPKTGGSFNPGFGKAFPMDFGDSKTYCVGDKVRHMKFGNGIVTEVKPAGSDAEITVDFERVGEKKMFASLVKMKKL